MRSARFRREATVPGAQLNSLNELPLFEIRIGFVRGHRAGLVALGTQTFRHTRVGILPPVDRTQFEMGVSNRVRGVVSCLLAGDGKGYNATKKGRLQFAAGRVTWIVNARGAYLFLSIRCSWSATRASTGVASHALISDTAFRVRRSAKEKCRGALASAVISGGVKFNVHLAISLQLVNRPDAASESWNTSAAGQ